MINRFIINRLIVSRFIIKYKKWNVNLFTVKNCFKHESIAKGVLRNFHFATRPSLSKKEYRFVKMHENNFVKIPRYAYLF